MQYTDLSVGTENNVEGTMTAIKTAIIYDE